MKTRAKKWLRQNRICNGGCPSRNFPSARLTPAIGNPSGPALYFLLAHAISSEAGLFRQRSEGRKNREGLLLNFKVLGSRTLS